MTAKIYDVCQSLADVLKDALDLKYAFGSWQPTPRPFSVLVVPSSADDFISYENGSFCRPAFSVSAWILGPTADAAKAFETLCDYLDAVPAVVDADPTLAGAVSNLMVDAVGTPGVVNTTGVALMTAEVRFRPFFLT